MKDLRKAFFYGWWVALAAALGVGLGSPPIFVFSFPVFLKALTKEFHANRSAIALAFSLHNLASAAVAPFAGRVIDRLGARRVVLPCMVLTGALLLGNGLITISVLGVYLFNVLGALIGIGAGPLPYSAVISTWFDRRRGTALAVMMFGLGISSMVMPWIVQRVVTRLTWRMAYALYGAATLLMAWPTVAVLLRDSPREFGAIPRWRFWVLVPYASGWSYGAHVEGGRRTSRFWWLLGAVVLLGASVHGCVIHLAAMLTDKGLTPRAQLW